MILRNTSILKEIKELQEQLKEYLHLYYFTRSEEHKIVISKIVDSIKYLESKLSASTEHHEKEKEQ